MTASVAELSYTIAMRLCKIENCGKESKNSGMCWGHYARVRRYGDPNRVRILAKDLPCTIEGCEKLRKGKGMCGMHYYRTKRNGSPHIVLPHPGMRPRQDGEMAGYAGAHLRVRRAKGKASEHPCIDGCGRSAQEWSYNHKDPNSLVSEKGLVYSLYIEHYEPRCSPCHARWDLER